MRRVLLTAMVAVMAGSGCGDDKKAVPPAGPMTPPGPGAEREGGKGKGKGQESNAAHEK